MTQLKFISIIFIFNILNSSITLARADHRCEIFNDESNNNLKTMSCVCNKTNIIDIPTQIDRDIQVFKFVGDPWCKDVRVGNMFKNLPELLEFKISYTSIEVVVKELLEKSTKLVKIDLSNNKIYDFYADSWANLKSLKFLNLSNNKIENEPFASYVFKHLNQLEILDLSNNEMKSLNDQVLYHLDNLKKLILSGNDLKEIKSNAINRSLTNLNYLNLSSCHLENIDFEFFDKIPNLQTLDISSNNLQQIDENIFKNLTNLNYVNLSSNNLKVLNGNVFESKKLEYLDLSNNQLTSLSRNVFNKMEVNILKLSNNFNLNHTQLIKEVLSNINIVKDLDLSFIGLKDEDLQNDPFKEQTYSLEKLNISHNHLKVLPKLQPFRMIRELDLSYNSFADLNDIYTKLPTVFEDVKKNHTYVHFHHNPYRCYECDIPILLSVSQFNSKCLNDNFYDDDFNCLKCDFSSSFKNYDVRNLTNLNISDYSNCQLPRELMPRIYPKIYSSDFIDYLIFTIILVIVSIFILLAVLYRRQIIRGIYFPGGKEKSHESRSRQRKRIHLNSIKTRFNKISVNKKLLGDGDTLSDCDLQNNGSFPQQNRSTLKLNGNDSKANTNGCDTLNSNGLKTNGCVKDTDDSIKSNSLVKKNSISKLIDNFENKVETARSEVVLELSPESLYNVSEHSNCINIYKNDEPEIDSQNVTQCSDESLV